MCIKCFNDARKPPYAPATLTPEQAAEYGSPFPIVATMVKPVPFDDSILGDNRPSEVAPTLLEPAVLVDVLGNAVPAMILDNAGMARILYDVGHTALAYASRIKALEKQVDDLRSASKL